MPGPLSLSGPELPPAAGGAARHLVLLLHGYGADGRDLLGLAPHWARLLPRAAFVAPDAPFPCELGFGHQWFGFEDRDPALLAASAFAAAGVIGYSGALIAPERLAGEVRSRPPILLVHGDADPVVPYREFARAADALREAGLPVQVETLRGLAHGIDEAGLMLGGRFLAQVFKATTGQAANPAARA